MAFDKDGVIIVIPMHFNQLFQVNPKMGLRGMQITETIFRSIPPIKYYHINN